MVLLIFVWEVIEFLIVRILCIFGMRCGDMDSSSLLEVFFRLIFCFLYVCISVLEILCVLWNGICCLISYLVMLVVSENFWGVSLVMCFVWKWSVVIILVKVGSMILRVCIELKIGFLFFCRLWLYVSGRFLSVVSRLDRLLMS